MKETHDNNRPRRSKTLRKTSALTLAFVWSFSLFAGIFTGVGITAEAAPAANVPARHTLLTDDIVLLEEEAPVSIGEVEGARQLEEGEGYAGEEASKGNEAAAKQSSSVDVHALVNNPVNRMDKTEAETGSRNDTDLNSAVGNQETILPESEDADDLPARFDPREEGNIPPLRDQTPTGLCWTFGACGCMEMNLLRKGLVTESPDLSERHLAYYFFKKSDLIDPLGNTSGDYNSAYGAGDADAYITAGGNNYLTIWHLASGCGPVAESRAPFAQLAKDQSVDRYGLCGQPNSLETAFGQNEVLLQNAYVLRIGDSFEDAELRKKMQFLIAEYGGLGTGYRANMGSAYENTEHDCYFYDAPLNIGKTNWNTNHNIVIVGWDDDFPKEYFNVNHQPEQNGAWLVRNSWGEENSSSVEKGYFWLSYEDRGLRQVIGSQNIKYGFVMDCTKKDTYDHIYQYDGNANFRNYPYGVAEAAAVFTAKGDEDENLTAVGIGVKNDGIRYKLQIYTNLTGESPDSGTLAHTQSGVIPYSGYSSIPLTKEVPLKSGEDYSIVFTDMEVLEKESPSDDPLPLIHVACSERMEAKISGGIRYYWDFFSDASKDRTYCRTGSDKAWVDVSDLCQGTYYVSDGAGNLQENNDYFMKSQVDSFEESTVIKDGFTLRIKGYTTGGSVSGNGTVSGNDTEEGGKEGGKKDDQGGQKQDPAGEKKPSDSDKAQPCNVKSVKLTGKSLKTAALTIRWNVSANADGYVLYRSSKKNKGYKPYRLLTNKNITKQKVPAAAKKTGKQYYYKVVSYIKGKDSDSARIETPAETVCMAVGSCTVKKVKVKNTGNSAGEGSKSGKSPGTLQATFSLKSSAGEIAAKMPTGILLEQKKKAAGSYRKLTDQKLKKKQKKQGKLRVKAPLIAKYKKSSCRASCYLKLGKKRILAEGVQF